ncbi:hypothetical protein PVK06_024457 [Gossypium arboreum]|uniref:Reverse transcriptase domain-containing protein n=1 Tax=Gossypium arboreum TaxID=29729 RepID=A0ABR0PDT0_GOSAR|nr:hypothetical protein PVK06_024457 [Gossypium arboreum]
MVECVSTAKAVILVNEVLHLVLVKAEVVGLIKGIYNVLQDQSVSHLQFADDTILFLKAEEEVVRNVKYLLRKSVLFWEDVWCGDKTLKEEFPKLFRLALKKNCFVKDVARNNSFEEVHWESVFSRKLLDREKCTVEKLKFLMSSVVLNEELEDRINWIHESGGIFSVKKLSYLLARDGMGAIEFQFDRIRKLKVPPRYQQHVGQDGFLVMKKCLKLGFLWMKEQVGEGCCGTRKGIVSALFSAELNGKPVVEVFLSA